MCHPVMLCVFIMLFCFANSEWVEISPIVNSKNASGAFESSTSNYENILITPFSKDEYIFTTSIYDISQVKAELITRSSVADVKTEPIIRHRHGVRENVEIPPHSTMFDEGDDSITDGGDNYEGFFSFLKTVQNKLMSYKTNSQSSKLSVLKHLRNNLLVNINQRVSKLWMPTISKEARGYKDEEEEYHMEFPSNEGALMTIGFLTFAVFLIKLVIKLVQALKYKYEYYGTTTTTTTAASIIFLNRKKRDEIMEDSAKIMQYIDEYPNTLVGHAYS